MCEDCEGNGDNDGCVSNRGSTHEGNLLSVAVQLLLNLADEHAFLVILVAVTVSAAVVAGLQASAGDVLVALPAPCRVRLCARIHNRVPHTAMALVPDPLGYLQHLSATPLKRE